jgi:hypothetical protein
MLRKALAAMLIEQLLFCNLSFGHPMFLIKPVSPSAQAENALGKSEPHKDKPTRSLKSPTAHTNETLFFLPKDLLQLDITVVVYVNSNKFVHDPTVLVPEYVPPTTSDKKKKKKAKQTDGAGSDSDDNGDDQSDLTSDLSVHVTARPPISFGLNGQVAGAARTTVVQDALEKLKKQLKDTQNQLEETKQSLEDAKTKLETDERYIRNVDNRPFPAELKLTDAKPASEKTGIDWSNVDFVAVIPDKIAVTLKPVPDPKLCFKVELGDLQGLVSDTKNAQISKSTNNVLNGIQSEFADQTAQIIADIGVTGTDVASFAGKVAAGSSGKFLSLELPLGDTDKQKQYVPPPLFRQAFELKVTRIVDLPKTVDDSINHKPEPIPIDLGRIKNAVVLGLKRKGFSGDRTISFPTLNLEVNNRLIDVSSSDLICDQGYEGIVFREPLLTHLILRADNNYIFAPVVADEWLTIAQTGSFSSLEIRKYGLSDAKRDITLSECGGAQLINGTGDSPIKELSGAIRQIGDALNGISTPAKTGSSAKSK